MDNKMEAAILAATENDAATARELLREILRENPEHEQAWLWMSRVAESDRERRLCLRQVLRIDPQNYTALQALESGDVPEQARKAPPAPPPPEPEREREPPPPPPPPAPGPTTYRPASKSYAEIQKEFQEAAGRPVWVSVLIVLLVGALIIAVLAVAIVLVPQLIGADRDMPTAVTFEASATESLAHPKVTGEVTPTGTEPPPPTVTAATTAEATSGAQAEALPDLVVKQVKIELKTAGGCLDASAQLGTTVVVGNAGDADAGPFAVEVNGTQQGVPDGLAAGGTTTLWFTGYSHEGDTRVVVDAESQVEDRDLENNTYLESVPLPTPPPTCTPPPGAEAPPEPGDVSIAHAGPLAPVQFTSSAIYATHPSSFLQVEVDAQGNARVVMDAPGRFEEWYVIDGTVYAGENAAEGLSPFEAVDRPVEVAGFGDALEVFAPRGAADRFTPVLPLHAILWAGVALDGAEKLGTETVLGLAAGKYQLLVGPEGVPDSVSIAGDTSEDLAEALASNEENRVVHVWVEPESGAILKAEWNIVFADGERGQYTLDLAQADAGPFELPTGEEPPAADEGTQSPELTVVTYWGHINDGQFEAAWDLLSPDYQARTHDGNYEDYVTHYQDAQLCSVTTTDVGLDHGGADSAIVAAQVVSRAGANCKKRVHDYHFHMVYDAEQDLWLIDAEVEL